jgi:hypothetical protein
MNHGRLSPCFQGCLPLSVRLRQMIDTIIYEANDWFGNRTGNEFLSVIIAVYLVNQCVQTRIYKSPVRSIYVIYVLQRRKFGIGKRTQSLSWDTQAHEADINNI